VEDRDVAPARTRVGELPDVIAEVVVYRERVELGFVPHPAKQIADAARAVADGVPFMSGWHPLINDHICSPNLKSNNLKSIITSQITKSSMLHVTI
jgi:hypothetical protein